MLPTNKQEAVLAARRDIYNIIEELCGGVDVKLKNSKVRLKFRSNYTNHKLLLKAIHFRHNGTWLIGKSKRSDTDEIHINELKLTNVKQFESQLRACKFIFNHNAT